MIAVIDYGLGNLASVVNALAVQQIPFLVTDKPEDIRSASTLILPGVGAAAHGMNNLRERSLDICIREQANRGKPLLGICLGMQLLFTSSSEGDTACLNLIPGTVRRFSDRVKVPHVGWNQVKHITDTPLWHTIPDQAYLYFVHSYYCDPWEKNTIVGTTHYGREFCSAVMQKNIWGVQFHPEKSAAVGLQLIKNFSNLAESN